MRPEKKQKGAVLIVVLGVLVILALLATTFATLQQLDRSVSRNYVDDVRAKMLAQSGVEYGISEIRDMMSKGFFSSAAGSTAWVYYGDVTDETQAANPATPIELAKNPSWAQETDNNPTSGATTPRQITIRRPDNSTYTVGYTASLAAGRHAVNGDIYSLRVVDASGMIYVNDGMYQYGGANSTVSLNLKRILNNLGKHPQVNIQNLGDKILNARGSGYVSKYDLRKAVNYNDTDFNKFKDFVSTQAWVDKNVVNPVPLSTDSATLASYPVSYWRGNASPVMRRGRGYNNVWNDPNLSINANWWNSYPLRWYQNPAPGGDTYNHNAIYGHDELFPQYIEVVWRAPVNINTAPEPVLSALIADVRGFFSIERRRFSPYTGSPKTFTESGVGYGNYPISCDIPQAYYTWMYVSHSFSPETTSSLLVNGQSLGGDEIGNLYPTETLFMPGSGTATGISAKVLADHIIKCRQKGSITSTRYDGASVTIDYSTKAFGGQFKNWAQFYEFLDNLVEAGILWDSRTIYGDFLPGNPSNSGPWPQTYTQATVGSANNKFASYAMADALKANFNPNCVLNETNPDRNMYLRVDKTDLICNSTEFCFTPMGYYEIESLGRVLRPEGNQADAAAPGVVNQVVAEKKILVTVKLYDAYRESTQRHFYGGTLALRQTAPETNNNRAVEIGPEPDNGPLVYTDWWSMGDPDNDGYAGVKFRREWDGYAGPAPSTPGQGMGWGFEYGGYLALPTIGGNWSPTNYTSGKSQGTLWTTLQGGSHFGSVIHSHFALDFKAHHHASADAHNNDWFRDEVGSVVRYANQYIDQIPYPFQPKPKVELTVNYEDPGEGTYSPYGPTYLPSGQNFVKYRMARSFRLPMQSATGGTQSLNYNLAPYAPSDLRIDGAYSERHSGIAYWMEQGVSWNEQAGIMSAWIKPSFFPEFSGKIRKVFSMARWHNKNYDYRNPNVWDMFYMPAHDKAPYQVSVTEGSAANYVNWTNSTGADHPVEAPEAGNGQGIYPFRPMSLNTGWGAHCYDGSLADFNDEGPWLEEENYSCTPSLNHRLHGTNQAAAWNGGNCGQASPLDKGKWMHVILRWNEVVDWYVTTGAHTIETYVNGQMRAGPSIAGTAPYAGDIFLSSMKKRYFTIHSFAGAGNWSQYWLSNTIRLGECSYHGFGTFPRNYSADMTFDEFYVWADNSPTYLGNAVTMWERGRYYKPGLGSQPANDGLFTSKAIDLNQVTPGRSLVPSSTTATPPYSTGTTSSGTTTAAPPPPKKRLLGVSWTTFAEINRPWGTKLIPTMYDYQNPSNPASLYQTTTGDQNGVPLPCVRVKILVDGVTLPQQDTVVGGATIPAIEGYSDDGFSQILDNTGKPYTVNDATNIRYQVWFTVKGVNATSVLLATPVFEDITLFYDQGDVEFLLYALVNTV